MVLSLYVNLVQEHRFLFALDQSNPSKLVLESLIGITEFEVVFPHNKTLSLADEAFAGSVLILDL